MKTIGIIGGMSWESTVTYYENINQEVITGKDYLRMANSEDDATALFKEKLRSAVGGDNIVYVISEPEQVKILPDGAVKVLVKADIDTIKERFKERMHGNLPTPVEHMLEKKHGMFDSEQADYKYDGVNGDAASLCRLLEERIAV